MKLVLLIFAITMLLIAASLTILFGQNKNKVVTATNDKVEYPPNSTNEKSVVQEPKFKRVSEGKIIKNQNRITAFKVEKKCKSKKVNEQNGKKALVLEQKNKRSKKGIERYSTKDKNMWELIKSKFSFDNHELATFLAGIGSNNITK